MTTHTQGSTKCRTCNATGLIKAHHTAPPQTCPVCEGAGELQLTPARVPVWYILGPQAIGANATVQASIQIDTSADFEWVFTMATSTSSLLNLSLLDGSTGRLITQPQATANLGIGNLPLPLFAGTAQLPFPLLEPYIVARGASLQFTLTDASGANNSLTLALMGFRLFPQQAQQQGSSGMVVQQQQ
jgi:hypothetical protein